MVGNTHSTQTYLGEPSYQILAPLSQEGWGIPSPIEAINS